MGIVFGRATSLRQPFQLKTRAIPTNKARESVDKLGYLHGSGHDGSGPISEGNDTL
jgi:hypothetical protein